MRLGVPGARPAWIYGTTGDCTIGGTVERKIWSSSADNDTTQVCRVDWQNGAGTAFGATNDSYSASGATAGLPKTVN